MREDEEQEALIVVSFTFKQTVLLSVTLLNLYLYEMMGFLNIYDLIRKKVNDLEYRNTHCLHF